MSAGPEQRLDSWKDIANYLGREVRTVIRWEQEKGLPVHRVPGGKRQAVYAYRSEIDSWLANGSGHQPEAPAAAIPPQDGESPAVGFHALPTLRPSSTLRDLPQTAGTGDSEVPTSPMGAATVRRAPHHHRLLRLVAFFGCAFVVMGLALLLRPALPHPQVLNSTQLTRDGRGKETMVTDGSRLYYSSFSGDQFSLYQVAAAGGESIPDHTSIPSPLVLDMSPDRSELLVGSFFLNQSQFQGDCALWILPVLGGSPHRVGNVRATGEVSAAWSLDGKEVVYAQGNSLFRAKADGSESRKMVTVPGNGVVGWPRWSPDGNRLRFSVDTLRDGESLWEANADGTNLHQLFSGWNKPPAECCGSWTPDGRYFLFESDRGGTSNIWAVREGSSLLWKVSRQPMRLTTGPASAGVPVPSPDGKKVFVTATQLRGELVRFDKSSRQFAPHLSGISATGVSFSRDRNWVTYVSYPDGTLWRSRVDGTERLQLTFAPLFVALPRWSPDGSRIAFMASRLPSIHFGVYVVSAEGGSLEQPLPADHTGSDPSWSADGQSLLYGRQPEDEPPGTGTLDLEILDLRTHAVSKIPGSQELWSPRWSPDGRHIAALTRDSDRVMVFDVPSHKWTAVVNMPSGWPEWSGNGDYIYFLGVPSAGGPSGIFRVRISDHKLERLVSLKDFRQATGVLADWVGLADDDSPILLRDSGTQDIYALDIDFP